MDDLFEHLMESERDKAINGFYTHFIVFLSVIAGLAVVNLISGDAFWIQWVVLGWGLGIALHAFLIFVRRPQQEQKLRELRRLREQKRQSGAAPAGEPASGSGPANSV
ncbi:2TM domain-containing protein [uncultured Hyphomicrobium sp.]|uniref:2TM domain-containing protein n=1 Tax=uncultured Hyphomicrobium sp. TaxID=194373 RepID=UPI0025F0A528|nr:2TM domain-containing protein [uncultured Hyphomicrobium sp.]